MELVKEENRFSLIDNQETLGYVEFQIEGDTLNILHTVVSDKFRGKGIARSLMEEVRLFAEKRDLRINPICSYAARYFGK